MNRSTSARVSCIAPENLHHGGIEMGEHEIWDGAAEDNSEALGINAPAHDAQRVRPICSPTCSIWVAPPSPARNTTAAAPSPNTLTATMLALVSSSCRSASEYSSRVTSS